MAPIACPPGFELSPSHRDLAGDRDGVAVRRHRPPRDRSTQPRGFVADRNRGRQPGLVMNDLYRFCRNPIFLAILIVLTGYTLLLPTRLSLTLLVGGFIGM